MALLNEKILINLILTSGKDYVTFEELRNFEKFYQQQLWQKQSNSYQEIIQNINEINDYPVLQNYNDGFFIKDVTKFQELNKFNLDEKIINQINNYLNFLRTITRYVVFPIKDFVNAFGYIEENPIYYIVVKAYMLEQKIKYEWPQDIIKYRILFSNPGIERLNQDKKLKLPSYISERWLNEIEVEKVFISLKDALKEKQFQNQKLKTQYGSKCYLLKRKEYLKLWKQYEEEIAKFEKLEKLIFEKQINIKVLDNSHKKVRKL